MPKQEGSNTFSRRDFLRIAGLGAAGLILTGCSSKLHIGSVDHLILPATPTSSAAAGMPGPEGKQGPKGETGPQGPKGDSAITQEAEVTFDREIDLGNGNKIRTKNIPGAAEGTVDVAKGQFTNTVGGGTEIVFAEPGVEAVGPDFGSKSDKNPYGNNPAGWDAMYGSEGSIQPFSPVNQELLRYEGPASQNLPEGGFILFTGAKARIKINDVAIDLPAVENNNYMVVVRGRFGDNQQNTDRNITTEISNYFPGHAQIIMYPARDKTNAAFISEGQFLQMVETSHNKGNSGDGGASKLTLVGLDINTKALVVLQQDKGKGENVSTGWRSLFKNFNARPTR